VTTEPALRFWLDFVERQGALREDVGDEAVVLLTPELQRSLSLPEEVAVTADPVAAREDGALLLIAGHPLVDQVAEAVLAEGDAGHLYLAWPRSRPPDAAELLARAREAVPVDHGRLDATGEPVAVRWPLLRVGALVSYVLGERFQEREEVWVDACSARELPEAVRRPLETVPGLSAPGDGEDRAVLRPDVADALGEVRRLLEARTARREAVLLQTVRSELNSELARADAYYGAVLESIAQRRATAPPERQALLDAQAEATESERARRTQEIQEKFRARHEVRPFRLHLLLAPALHLPLVVRRGERRYPFGLGWLLQAGAFAPVRCPHCRATAPLVAGRERLGCAECLGSARVTATRAAGTPTSPGTPLAASAGPGSPVTVTPAAALATDTAPVPAVAPSLRTGSGTGVVPGGVRTGHPAAAEAAPGPSSHTAPHRARGPGRPARPARPPGPAGDPAARAPGSAGTLAAATPAAGTLAAATPAGSSRPTRARVAARPGRPQHGLSGGSSFDATWAETLAEYDELRRRVRRLGERLASDFWSSVLSRELWPAGALDPGSPLAALYRLYGPQGPLVALGLPPGRQPARLVAGTPDPDLLGRTVTCGRVFLGSHDRAGFPFTLRWQLRGETAVLSEVLPFPEAAGTDLPPLADLAPAVAERLTRQVPRPRRDLDGVAAQLWERALVVDGLPLVLRCLGVWWESGGLRQTALFAPDDRFLAVALVDLVGRASGLRRTRAATAEAYGVPPRPLALAIQAARPLLVRGWSEA
jgi:hypothetical protein